MVNNPLPTFSGERIRFNGASIYAVYEQRADGEIRVSEDANPPGEIMSFLANGLGAFFDITPGKWSEDFLALEIPAYFNVKPGDRFYEDVAEAIGLRDEAHTRRIEADRKSIERELAEAIERSGFPRGKKQVIDAVLATHAARFPTASRPKRKSTSVYGDGALLDVYFTDAKKYRWCYREFHVGNLGNCKIEIEADPADAQLRRIGDYLEAHGDDRERQVMSLAGRCLGDPRYPIKWDCERERTASQLMAQRAGEAAPTDREYRRFDKVIQDLLEKSNATRQAKITAAQKV